MKKGLFLVSILLLIFLGINMGKNYAHNLNVPTKLPSSTIQASNAATPIPTITYYPPKILSIPKLNIQANVESVGLDSQGRMDVPKNVQDVGWYSLGFKAGEKGSVVIDGHFDDVNGSPVVFYYLNNLTSGDEISVTDENGKVWKYKVYQKVAYDFDKLPLKDIFASTDMARLNLITCNGTWDLGSKNYSKRLVVYSKLED